jgi:hypothetical protein
MGAAMALNLFLLALSERGILPFGWSWLVVLGTCGSYALAYAFTRPASRASAPKPADVRGA